MPGMRALGTLSLSFLTLAGPLPAQAQVKGVRIWAAPDNTRVVFDLAAPVEHEILQLDNPERLRHRHEGGALRNRDPAQPGGDDRLFSKGSAQRPASGAGQGLPGRIST
ncbi:MAG: hypothetical protein U5P41_14600 [Gammaproteobacteria bacterium]|nr:hypothetical protein [Gammaproteobacteria bacterium]